MRQKLDLEAFDCSIIFFFLFGFGFGFGFFFFFDCECLKSVGKGFTWLG